MMKETCRRAEVSLLGKVSALRRISDLGYITAPILVAFYDTHGDTEDTFST